jgi:hypothetical protein
MNPLIVSQKRGQDDPENRRGQKKPAFKKSRKIARKISLKMALKMARSS